jgi:hypothetical protein
MVSENKKLRVLSTEHKAKISAAKKGKGRGAENSHWKGGRVLISGYWYVLATEHPNATKIGYVAEHRLVMEAALGRLLRPGEAVHHIDGNTENNALENLMVCASNGQHFVEHHLTARDEKGRFACA